VGLTRPLSARGGRVILKGGHLMPGSRPTKGPLYAGVGGRGVPAYKDAEDAVVRRHVRCADCRCDRAGNVRVGAPKTSRSVRRSCRNVTIGAPIRSRCVCHHRRHGGGARLYSHVERGTGRPDERRGGGWRSERDVVSAANVTLGATNVTAYTSSRGVSREVESTTAGDPGDRGEVSAVP